MTKNFDKSDNESSKLSLRSVGGNYKRKQSGLNEPIIEEEEEKEEGLQKIISETSQKRRKAIMQIKSDGNFVGNISKYSKHHLLQSDPIYEELEVEDDEPKSEYNFYTTWENHKKKLLTLDEQAKLILDETLS